MQEPVAAMRQLPRVHRLPCEATAPGVRCVRERDGALWLRLAICHLLCVIVPRVCAAVFDDAENYTP